MKKVFKIIRRIVLDIIIAFLLAVIAFSITNKNKPIPIFNHYFFTVLTGSMKPTLKPGNVIVVEKTDSFKVKDIVSYKKGDKIVTHRIIKIEGDKVITKGDANNVADPAINKKDIIGKYVYHNKVLDLIVKYKVYFLFGIVIIYLIYLLIKTIITE